MTRNEYKEYMRKLASKVHRDPNYTIAMYKADLDAVIIAPLDLSKFKALKKDTRKFINAFFDEEDTDRDGNYMLRGFTYHQDIEVKKFNCKYGDYTNGYSFYAYNDEEFMIYTYCEGDTTLTLYPNKESYDIGYKKTHDWYKREYGNDNEPQSVEEPPKEILDKAKAIAKRFSINGICDEMYISNVIARCNGLGDGESHFNGKTEIILPKQTAKEIQQAYGCNIYKEDIKELEEILKGGIKYASKIDERNVL